MDENYEKLGTLIDDLESLCFGLELKMSADFHLDQLKEILPKKRIQIMLSFIFSIYNKIN